ncbi:response regulator [Aromatoleum petrolei]|uniref:Response regulator n=1 Tax=Aromatoleum petrolei TaxID=76116 RepID=A0ABX1MXM9_9RHOO|nr:response regulator [Aromatoleum petrolei]NMF89817.1 response regulator [Aromatoleum petrolei]QTQ35078.1 Two component system response regulator, CheY-like [Aromatoleum petrolei]
MAVRILLVEDNPANLELVSYLLEAAGHTVLIAEDGLQGLELARSEPPPDLIISDLRMPVMDGFEMLRHIRTDAALNDIPVIAVTAFSMSGDQTRVMLAGFDGYISKPIVPETFVSEVEAYLKAGRRIAGPTAGE